MKPISRRRAFDPFRQFTGPNASNATRHRIIDDLLRERLSANRSLNVVQIGAGFDSRAFRLEGGRWLEVDEPQVFAWKEPRLPVEESPNPLTRLPVEFGAERLSDRLQPFADPGPAAIIVEGVEFFKAFSRPIHEKIQGLGASFELPERPIDQVFADERYRQTAQVSTTRRAVALGNLPWYTRLLTRLSRNFANGYSVRVFAP